MALQRKANHTCGEDVRRERKKKEGVGEEVGGAGCYVCSNLSSVLCYVIAIANWS